MKDCKRFGIALIAHLHRRFITMDIIAKTAHATEKFVKERGNHCVCILGLS
jgi:response regulator of citrate/malate metabolism